jgi:hypothetical protein
MIKSRKQIAREEFWNHIKLIPSEPELVYDYFQGMYRQFCFDRGLPFIRKKIIKEYIWRKNYTKAKRCVEERSCKCCGCKTPASIFCTRACSVSKYEHCGSVFKLEQCFPKMGEIDLNNPEERKKWEI